MGRLDKGLLLTIFFLIGLGLVQVYSSSFIFATESFNDGQFFFRKQFLFSILGLGLLLSVSMLPWKIAEKCGILLFVCATIALVGTLVPGLGVKVGGAYRWIQLPMGFRFEPAELFKVTVPFFLAWLLTSKKDFLGPMTWLGKIVIFTIPLIILLKQPDFGSFAIIMAVSFGLFFAFGLKWRYILGMLIAAVPLFYFLVLQVPYRRARVISFLDPWADPSDKGFQVIQSLLSMHSGGISGVGLGLGQGKLFFLPEAHTDFTLAVLGEEWGFLGLMAVFIFYGLLVFRGFQISLYSKCEKQRVIALGITLMFGLSVFINAGVTMGLLPTKGLTMPFMSYGGSSLVSSCLAFGWLLNIDKQHRITQPSQLRKYKVIKSS